MFHHLTTPLPSTPLPNATRKCMPNASMPMPPLLPTMLLMAPQGDDDDNTCTTTTMDDTDAQALHPHPHLLMSPTTYSTTRMPWSPPGRHDDNHSHHLHHLEGTMVIMHTQPCLEDTTEIAMVKNHCWWYGPSTTLPWWWHVYMYGHTHTTATTHLEDTTEVIMMITPQQWQWCAWLHSHHLHHLEGMTAIIHAQLHARRKQQGQQWWRNVVDGPVPPMTLSWQQWCMPNHVSGGHNEDTPPWQWGHIEDRGMNMSMTRIQLWWGEDMTTMTTMRMHQGWGCKHTNDQDVTTMRRW